MVNPKWTIFQACHAQGIVIPRFCYHEKLSVAGNCRMCLVEVEKAPKPVAACAAGLMPGMRIQTESELTYIARGGVMEFLLANHPLDCPICDQGGECDLQDISLAHGYKTGRFIEYKRAVEDKNLGPLISTIMNRCIHCTRCIRFSEEVAGNYDLGTVGRGTYTEVGTYIEKMATSELSGNIVDLCPVGALTNAPYAFTSRPWELQKTHSIDLMEAISPSVEFNYRGPEIMRVLPIINNEVNEEWISDKSRYSYDGLKRQRLAFPLKKNSKTQQFEEVLWEDILPELANRLSSVNQKNILGLVGEFNSLESLVVLKDLMNSFNSDAFMFDNYPFQGHQRSDYLMNKTITEFDQIDNLILVGCNPKLEAPVFNARILKAVRHSGLKVFKLGPAEDLTYEYIHLGNNIDILNKLFDQTHPLCKSIQNQKSHIIVGSTVCSQNPSANKILQSLKGFAEKQSSKDTKISCGVMHRFIGPLNGYELGLNYQPQHNDKGNDNEQFLKKLYSKKQMFSVYIGTHGDIGARYADVVLPCSAWSEQDGTYVNIEGRVQQGRMSVLPPALAKEEWKIIKALSDECGHELPYQTLEEIRYRLSEINPAFLKYNFIEPYSLLNNFEQKKLPFEQVVSTIDNYYKTDAISRASVVMSKCSSAFNNSKMSNFLKDSYLK